MTGVTEAGTELPLCAAFGGVTSYESYRLKMRGLNNIEHFVSTIFMSPEINQKSGAAKIAGPPASTLRSNARSISY